MAFVSYAQNFEDVMLARALEGVANGFYIDVGAQDPEDDSVSKHFYDKGWRGMNFEPSEHYFARLEAERPRDINLCSAVGETAGSITFYEEEGTGLSTIVEAVSTAENRVARTVPMTTLDAACATYHIAIVHFLKIDVEGAEHLVLRGLSLEKLRPWIIVLEATKPNSPEPYYEHWEPLLTERDYDFVYGDGLNRFYLARERGELARHFAFPPNHFDTFVRASEVKADLRAEARWADNLAHHVGIIERMGADLASKQEALEDHAARMGAMDRQLSAQQAEIERLAALLTETSKTVDALRFDKTDLQAEIEALNAEIARKAGQIAFRDAKVGWLTQDRDRYRTAHGKITASLFWRLTGPIQNRGLRAATLARSVPTRTSESGAPPPPAPALADLPDTVRFFAQRLS